MVAQRGFEYCLRKSLLILNRFSKLVWFQLKIWSWKFFQFNTFKKYNIYILSAKFQGYIDMGKYTKIWEWFLLRFMEVKIDDIIAKRGQE